MRQIGCVISRSILNGNLFYNTSASGILVFSIYPVPCIIEFDVITSVAYSEPSQTSKMVLSVKILNDFQPFTILGKSSILDV